jgi:hypothetical protein
MKVRSTAAGAFARPGAFSKEEKLSPSKTNLSLCRPFYPGGGAPSLLTVSQAQLSYS